MKNGRSLKVGHSGSWSELAGGARLGSWSELAVQASCEGLLSRGLKSLNIPAELEADPWSWDQPRPNLGQAEQEDGAPRDTVFGDL